MQSAAEHLPPSFDRVYRQEFTFVWRTLRALGVHEASLEDATQDVFVVVHRRLPQFEGRAAIRTWAYEIARRVALRYRGRAARHASRHTELLELQGRDDLEAQTDQSRARALMHQFLWSLDEDRRRAFVLSEFCEMSGREIGEALGVNMNTVYARIRSARTELERLAKRERARDTASLTRAAGGRPPSPDVRKRTLASLLVAVSAPTSASLSWGLAAAAFAALLVGAVGWAATRDAPPQAIPVVEAEVVAAASPPAPRAVQPAAEPPPPPSPATPALAPKPTPPKPKRPTAAPSLDEELALVRTIRAAVRTDDRAGLRTALRTYRARFTRGALRLEVEALQVEAACRAHAPNRHAQLATFRSTKPDRALLERLTALCERNGPQNEAAPRTHPP